MSQEQRVSTVNERGGPGPAPLDDRRLRRWGVLIVLSIFGGLGTWAALAPLSSAARAPGVVGVESHRKTVQHLEGGIIKSIDVRDGERVENGQVLVTLEGTQQRAQLEVVRGEYFITQAREARLVAQRDGRAEATYPPDLLAQNDARVQDAVRVQNQTLQVRKSAHDGEQHLYEEQIAQLKAKAEGLHAQRVSRQRLVTSYTAELADFEALLAQGYAEKQKVREFERNLANADGEVGELTSNLAAIELQISETRLKILQLDKELQREVAKELAEVQVQLFELREKVQSLEDVVARSDVRAPQAGLVLDLQVHTLGAVVAPGGKILDIVPQGERLIVEAKVSPMDIDRVRVGLPAEIRFTAFKQRDTPRVDGTLVAVSADGLVDQSDEHKTPYYLARVEITPKGVKDLAHHNLVLVAGMPAEVLIETGKRTLLNYLTDPLKNTVARSFIED